MSRLLKKTNPRSAVSNHLPRTEEEFQEMYADSSSPVVRAVMNFRRKHLREGGRFLSRDEINREVMERRGGALKE